jgi:cytochrome bd ubiquinol oxidase subunit II
MDLNTTWFLLVGVLIIGYAILDGFDLGVGVLHLFAKSNDERRIHLNAIGPVWDGNEVWLLTAGGALFAAFPIVYARVFSAFYLALMLLLTALIFRAVSMEFRGKVDSPKWRRVWDWAFGLGSLLPAVLFGVAVGNILRGIPLDASRQFTGSFLGLLNPYAILIGLLSLVMCVMHGATYMTLKTGGELQTRMRGWASRGWLAFVVLYGLATLATKSVAPWHFAGLAKNPLFWALLPLMLAAVWYFNTALKKGKYFPAFLASSAMIATMIGLAALSMFPLLAPSSIDLANSLTIYNAASTPRTQMVMLVIALVGMPIVIGYTAFIYTRFKGKVVIGEESY